MELLNQNLGPIWVHSLPNTMQLDPIRRRKNLSETTGYRIHYCFGTRGSEVRILSPRPLNQSLTLKSGQAALLGFPKRVPTLCHFRRRGGPSAEWRISLKITTNNLGFIRTDLPNPDLCFNSSKVYLAILIQGEHLSPADCYLRAIAIMTAP